MNKKEVLDYIDIATHNRIKERIQHCLSDEAMLYDIMSIKSDIEYYEQVMKYIKENLKWQKILFVKYKVANTWDYTSVHII